ncbi:MAG: trimeric intracellular cation channel family protein [Granulosicoccus sp.]
MKGTNVFLLDLISTHCFACIGALVALKARLNVWQVLAATMLTATGGGTIRDIFVTNELIFWLKNFDYLVAVGLAIPVAMLLAKIDEYPPVLGHFVASAGTTVFIVVGTMAALSGGFSLAGVVAVGLLTGIGGGMLRQLFLESGFDVYRNAVDLAAALITAWLSSVFITSGMNPVLCVLLLCVHHTVLLALITHRCPACKLSGTLQKL